MSKRIIFYTHTLNFRGVTNSILNFAHHNQEILGNESIIMYSPVYDIKSNAERDIDNNIEIIKQIKNKFELLECRDWNHTNDISSKYDVFYSQKAGLKEQPLITNTKSVVHSVFQYDEPHGDVYAYVSEWLSDFMLERYKVKHPWVPLIVNQPISRDYRKEWRTNLGISENQFVYGRLGGETTLDLDFVQDTIKKIVNESDDFVFVFPNTAKFYEHKNIHYIPPILNETQKTDYINMCDAMIHARERGETFGLGMMEFLAHNKPVLAWDFGVDRNHMRILEPFGLLYDEDDVYHMMTNLPNRDKVEYKLATIPYSPDNVMKKFKEVFL